jgi:hypothetical protein
VRYRANRCSTAGSQYLCTMGSMATTCQHTERAPKMSWD